MAPLSQSSPHPSVFLFTVGLILLGVGCLSLASPQAFDIPAYPDALRQVARASLVFIAAGILTLLSYATAVRRGGLVPALLAVLGSAPFWLSALMAGRGGAWSQAAVAAALGAGLVIEAVVARGGSATPDGIRRVPTLAVVAGALEAVLAVIALRVPRALVVAPALAAGAVLPWLGAGLLAGAALLAAGWWKPRYRTATQVAAAVPLGVLAAESLATGRWAGVLTYGLLAAGLAAEPWLAGVLRARAVQRLEQPQPESDYELATEAAAWGVALLAAVAGSLVVAPGRRLGLAVLVLAMSLFTVFWFHIRSARQAGLRDTVRAATVYALIAAVLVHLTGGARSPFLFVYVLPVLALAWSRRPAVMAAPLAVVMASHLVEVVLALRSEGAAVVVFRAVSQGVLLGLVVGFAYLLSMRSTRLHSRLEEARSSLEAVMAHMGEGLITTDREGRITLCNPAAAVLMGNPPETRGRLLTEVLPLRRPDGRPLEPDEHPASRALAGRPIHSERLLAAADPQAESGARPRPGQIALAVTATPLADPAGDGGAIVVLRDVSADVEMERMRDDFFFIASHELRTPLTVIKGNLEMALEAAPPGPLRTAVEEALASTARLIRLANDYLTAARLEHGAVELRLEEAALPPLVRQAVATLRSDALRKGLDLVYHAPADLPPVRIDVERTLQILLNLLANGLRHTGEGRVEVSHALDGGVVETLVRDTGVGIAPEHHARLFARFGQVERGLTRATSGSGLGLYICRTLAAQMGGDVVLKHSAPGQGSTFALRLPVATSAGEGPGARA